MVVALGLTTLLDVESCEPNHDRGHVDEREDPTPLGVREEQREEDKSWRHTERDRVDE